MDGKKLRLFATLSAEPAAAKKAEGGAVGVLPPPPLPSHHSPWTASCTSRLAAQHDLATSSLLIRCLALGLHSTGTGTSIEGFDRQAAPSDSGNAAGAAASTADTELLAPALAEHLVPGWRRMAHLAAPALRLLLEAPCVGVPGLCGYAAARDAWLSRQLALAIDGDGCRQVVVLRAGWSTWSHSLAQEGVTWFEVDTRQAVRAKREVLDDVVPGWRRSVRRPRFVEVPDWTPSGLRCLVTELTAAGFQAGAGTSSSATSARCVVVAEGLLQLMAPEAVDGLLRDLSALCAPGSRFLFDFLHASGAGAAAPADGSAGAAAGTDQGDDQALLLLPPGYAALAAALASKGSPLASALKPAFADLTRLMLPHGFRMAQLLPPHQVASLLLQQPVGQQPAPGGAKAGLGAAAASSSKGQAASTVTTINSRQQAPYVPEFWSLVSAVKMGPQSMQRTPAALRDASAGLLSEWAGAGANAALSSPSCLLQSLASLLWGWGLPSGRGRAAAGVLEAPRRQLSSEWTLPAHLSGPEPLDGGGGAAGEEVEAVVAAAGQRQLERAVSVGARLAAPDVVSGCTQAEDRGHLAAGAGAEPGGMEAAATVPAAVLGAAGPVGAVPYGSALDSFWWEAI